MRKRSRQEAPAEGISLSAQLSQAAAWRRVWDECQRLGMDTSGAPSTRTGLDIVLDFIRGHAAPQEAREPEALRQTIAEAVERLADRLYPYWRSSEGDGSDYLAVANTIDVLAGKLTGPAPETREPDGWAVRMRDGSWRSTVYKDRETAERMAVKAREFFAARGDEDDEFDSIDVLPVYLGAPMPSETLLPCPFCGGEAVRITTRYSENCDTVKASGGQTLFRGVKCIVCGARTSTVVGYRTPGEADAAWNRRATPQEAREDEFDPIDVLRGAWKAAREALGLPTAPEEGAGGMTDTEAKATPLSDAAVARIIEDVEAHCGMGRGAWDMVSARDLVEGFAAAFGADTSGVLLPTAPGAPEAGAAWNRRAAHQERGADARCVECGTEIDNRCEDCRSRFRCEACGQRITDDDDVQVWEDGVYTHRGDCPAPDTQTPNTEQEHAND